MTTSLAGKVGGYLRSYPLRYVSYSIPDQVPTSCQVNFVIAFSTVEFFGDPKVASRRYLLFIKEPVMQHSATPSGCASPVTGQGHREPTQPRTYQV